MFAVAMVLALSQSCHCCPKTVKNISGVGEIGCCAAATNGNNGFDQPLVVCRFPIHALWACSTPSKVLKTTVVQHSVALPCPNCGGSDDEEDTWCDFKTSKSLVQFGLSWKNRGGARPGSPSAIGGFAGNHDLMLDGRNQNHMILY